MKNGKLKSEEPVYKTWWYNRSKLERRLVITSFVSLLLLIGVLTAYLLITRKPEVCTSSSCVRTAMDLLNHIDVKVNPCDDFYRFACGSFLRNANPHNQPSKSAQDIAEDRIHLRIANTLEAQIGIDEPVAFNLAKKFYRACMNETAIEAEGLKWIKQILGKMGGWPALEGDNWAESRFDWKDAVHKLRRAGINSGFFIVLAVEKDKTDPTRYILSLKDPTYSPSRVSEKVKQMYLDYMEDIAIIFGATPRIARKDQKEVLDLILKLAKISEEAQSANGSYLYNPLTVSELEYKFHSIDWKEYINGVLAPSASINYDDIISARDPVYLRNLEYVLQKTRKRTLANFIAWNTLQQLVHFLPSEIVEKTYEYYEKVNGRVIRDPRWKTCVKAVEERMGMVVSAVYLEHNFDEDKRHKIMQLIRNIKEQFNYNLQHFDWLDQETKKIATGKLLTSVEHVATYKELIDSLEENHMYENVEVFENEFLMSALNLEFANVNKEFGKLRDRAKDDWYLQPSFLSGMEVIFVPKENTLRFPIGVMTELYFEKERPHCLNYGALGSVVAHEISHVIIEAEYKELGGDLRSWWSVNSLMKYEEKRRCLSSRYQQLTASLLSPMNTSITIEEDMADLAGMKVAHDAYLTWISEHGSEPVLPGLPYTARQLFWISAAIHRCSAQSTETLEKYIANYRHSPEKFRVNGPLQNIVGFSNDFGCTYGDYMNPKEKCFIW